MQLFWPVFASVYVMTLINLYVIIFVDGRTHI